MRQQKNPAQLLIKISQAWQEKYTAVANSQGFHYHELMALDLIDADGSMMAQQDLLQMMQLDAAQLTRVLSRLEQRGFIKKNLGVSDKRQRFLQLTLEALPHIEQIKALREAFGQMIQEALSANEFEQFNRLLEKIADQAQ